MGRVYRVGTRSSPLALRQANEVLSDLGRFYPSLETEVIKIDTYGDKDKETPISQIEGTDFFTKEIDDALLGGAVDFSVHSAKDLPDKLPGGLAVAAITESIDPFDALVSKQNLKLDQMPRGAKIGTSSRRRKEQLKNYREDFEVVDLRGNIEERLAKLEGSDLAAIVIAAAGLIRLELADWISQKIPFRILKPHPLQGSLAVSVRAGDKELFRLLSVINSRESALR